MSRLFTAGRPFRLRAADLGLVLVASTRYKPEAHPLAREVAQRLGELGADVLLDLEGSLTPGELPGGLELAIAVGGDGTMLNTARLLVGSDVPVLGVNLGKLGFLAGHGAEDVSAWLEGGEAPSWRTVSRLMLQLTVEKPGVPVHYGLNDVIVSQGVMNRLINIDMAVDGLHATQYRADGVVISTPTGSTAYSLSLGGPILSQGLRALLITPIAPHALTNRPIVLDGFGELQFEVVSPADELALIVDGQERIDIEQGDRFRVAPAPSDLQLVVSSAYDHFDVLRRKLGWGASPFLDETAGC